MLIEGREWDAKAVMLTFKGQEMPQEAAGKIEPGENVPWVKRS